MGNRYSMEEALSYLFMLFRPYVDSLANNITVGKPNTT